MPVASPRLLPSTKLKGDTIHRSLSDGLDFKKCALVLMQGGLPPRVCGPMGVIFPHTRGGGDQSAAQKENGPKGQRSDAFAGVSGGVSIQVTTFALLSLHAGSKIDQQAQCTKSLGRSRVKFLLRNS